MFKNNRTSNNLFQILKFTDFRNFQNKIQCFWSCFNHFTIFGQLELCWAHFNRCRPLSKIHNNPNIIISHSQNSMLSSSSRYTNWSTMVLSSMCIYLINSNALIFSMFSKWRLVLRHQPKNKILKPWIWYAIKVDWPVHSKHHRTWKHPAQVFTAAYARTSVDLHDPFYILIWLFMFRFLLIKKDDLLTN